MTATPPYVTRALVAQRLPLIFPAGTPNQTYCTRELAASTVFAMLYIGALEGSGIHLAPKHVYRMTTAQAAKKSDTARSAYRVDALKPRFQAGGERWYADNTREPIRDETLREGLVAIGAVIAREDVPVTSSKPRYSLRSSFAALFDPALRGAELSAQVERWQRANLSKSALARTSIVRAGLAGSPAGVLVTFPTSGETRTLTAGPSSMISKAVIEEFARRFLIQPAVLWLSESGNKVVARDDAIAAKIGLAIAANKNLPDAILVDLGPADPLIVFVEVVATDGAVTPRRRTALAALADKAGFTRGQIAFVSAYRDRDSPGFKKTMSSLAWGSFAWFASEPDCLVHLMDGESLTAKLAGLIQPARLPNS